MIKLATIFVLISCAMAQERTARLQLNWDSLAAKASEKVDVNLEGPMLEMASKFLGNSGDELQVKQLISGLTGIYVKSFEFEKEGQYSAADVNAIRAQLRSPEWSAVVDVRDKDESVTVYTKTDGKRTQGIVVVATEPKELTFVQLIGQIDPSMLGALSGKLGIPRMDFGGALQPKSRTKKKDD